VFAGLFARDFVARYFFVALTGLDLNLQDLTRGELVV
jgi:hypothetical protein